MGKKLEKVLVSTRVYPDVAARIDDAAKLMGISRAAYLEIILGMMHNEQFNPIAVASELLEKKLEEVKSAQNQEWQ